MTLTPSDVVLRHAAEAAPLLLGHVIERDEDEGSVTRARVVEVEAYDQDDPASHAFRGRTDANRFLFATGGTAYVYFTYGMHHCLNVATGADGHGQGVLLRAAEVLGGHDRVGRRRGDRPHPLSGPGNLAAGLGVDRSLAGTDLLDPSSPLRLVTGTPVADADVAQGPRVGVRLAADVPWRWWVRDHPDVSAYRRHPKAPPRAT